MADSQSPFRPSFLKLERAQQHISELERLADEYVASNPVTASARPLGAEERPQGMIVGWRFSLSVKEPPEQMSPIIGDIFHNLRSALDLMASALAIRNEKSSDDVYFPFAGSEGDLDLMISKRNFDRTGDAAVKLIKELKPYKGGNLELRAIHDLNIRDKHQELIVERPLSTASGPILDFQPEDGSGIKLMQDSVTTSVKLIFPKDCALADQELISTLKQLVELATGIVKSFEALGAPAG